MKNTLKRVEDELVGRLVRTSKAFREVVASLGLVDLDLIRGNFMWCNERPRKKYIKAHLDRAMYDT